CANFGDKFTLKNTDRPPVSNPNPNPTPNSKLNNPPLLFEAMENFQSTLRFCLQASGDLYGSPGHHCNLWLSATVKSPRSLHLRPRLLIPGYAPDALSS